MYWSLTGANIICYTDDYTFSSSCFLVILLKISIPKYRVGINDTNSVINPAIPTSTKSLSQSFATTDDNTSMINTIVAKAKNANKKLHTLYYTTFTLLSEPYGWRWVWSAWLRRYSRRGSMWRFRWHILLDRIRILFQRVWGRGGSGWLRCWWRGGLTRTLLFHGILQFGLGRWG